VKTGFVLFWAAVHACIGFAQSSGTFTAVADMTVARGGHTATLLTNGKVLIAGGGTSSAELYDPSTGSFTATGNMITARRYHTATLLADGRVLIAGGFVGNTNSPTASAELYDPSTRTFTAIGDVSRATSQAVHTATLLSNGKVLIAGIGANAVLYDAATGTFADTGPYADPNPGGVGTAALLSDGRVLIAGCTAGCTNGVTQLYDPDTNTFSLTGGPKPGCGADICWFVDVNTATLLMNGKVLFVGSDEYAWPADAELYDRSTGIFAGLGNTDAPHEFSTATLLLDGRVLVAGSQLPGGSGDPRVELYDPSSSKFAAAGNMMTARHSHTATLLPDGTVLIAGGNNTWPTPTSAAEIYHPAVLAPSPVLFSVSDDHQGAILHAATQQLVSAENPAVSGEILEVYGTGLADGSVIPPQVSIGGRMAEVLFFGKAPGYAGLNQINVRVPSGIRPGPSVSVQLNYLSRPSNQVTIAVQ
jgi:uncharacterized protein (TIGR03437 family)